MPALVSIIIPTYNRAHLIGETLDSVLSQTYQHWECIVVDDGSTDHTAELLEFYCRRDTRINFHPRPLSRPKGANSCRNYGFELSRGKYINWFDSDDLFHPDKLTIQVKALENSSYNFSVCQTMVFEDNIKNVLSLRHPRIDSTNSLADFISVKIVWLTQAPLWKTVFLNQMDYLFDEELHAAQEWEFYSRCLYYSPEYHSTELPLVYIRKHDQSISYGPQEQKNKNYHLAKEKVFDFLKSKGIYDLFLSNYFIHYFQTKVMLKDFDESYRVLMRRLIFNKRISGGYRFKLLLVFCSYFLFGRGEILFKGKKVS